MRKNVIHQGVGGLLALVVLLSSSGLFVVAADESPKVVPELQSIIDRAPVKPKENQVPGEAIGYAAILINVDSQEYSLSIDFADRKRAFARNVKPETVMLVHDAFAHPDKLGVLAYYRVEDNTIDFLMVFSKQVKKE